MKSVRFVNKKWEILGKDLYVWRNRRIGGKELGQCCYDVLELVQYTPHVQCISFNLCVFMSPTNVAKTLSHCSNLRKLSVLSKDMDENVFAAIPNFCPLLTKLSICESKEPGADIADYKPIARLKNLTQLSISHSSSLVDETMQIIINNCIPDWRVYP